jgi:hypothetical protein
MVVQSPSTNSPNTGISRPRLIVIYGLFAFILLGSFLDLVRDTEHWPWSCYPMYSYMETGTKFDDLRIYGVLNDGSEISLYAHDQYLQPFDQSRMAEILEVIDWKPGFTKAIENCYDRYESLRRKGKLDAPALVGMRVYRVYWTLDPYGKTIEHPDSKTRVGEYMTPGQGKKS